MRTLWAILMAGFLLVGTEKTGLGENTEENDAKSLKEKKLVIKKIWMINLEDDSKTRKQLSENIRQNMRLQEGNAYSKSELTNLIEIDVEEVFKIGNFVLLDIQTREPEDLKDSYLIDLEVYYMAKNRNAKGLYKEGVLAQVGEQKIYLNQLVRKLKDEEIALKEQLLTSRIHKETFNKKLSDIRKNYLDEEIVKAFCLEIYRQSPFKYPEYFFDLNDKKVIQEAFNGNRKALVQNLEEKGKTFGEWRRTNREGVILFSVSEFLKSEGKVLAGKETEAFYDSNIREYLTDWKSQISFPYFIVGKTKVPKFCPLEFISQKDSHGNSVFVEKAEDNTFYLNRIEIRHNYNTPDALIRGLIELKPGEIYNQEKAVKSLMQISNLNLFSNTTCYFKYFEDRDIKRKTMVVQCEEKNSNHKEIINIIKIVPGTKEILPGQFCNFISVTNLTLPAGLEKIGYGAFANCKKLKKTEIPESVKEVEPLAFAFCEEIDKIILPDTIKSIKFQAFHGCKSLVSAPVPPAMTNPPNVYSGCNSLKEYVVSPKHLTLKAIDGVLFSKDGRKLIHYPPGRSEEIYKVPSGCSIIGKNSFGSFSFSDSIQTEKRVEIVLPDSVSEIEQSAFDWSWRGIVVHLPKRFEKVSNQELEVMDLDPRKIRIRVETTPN